MNDKLKIGNIIRSARLAADLDRHTKLAKIIKFLYPDDVKISADDIGRYERGENMPPANKYRLIIRALERMREIIENKGPYELLKEIKEIKKSKVVREKVSSTSKKSFIRRLFNGK